MDQQDGIRFRDLLIIEGCALIIVLITKAFFILYY